MKMAERTAEQVTDPGTLSDAIRAMGFFSTVSAPIVVEGELWGVVTASSSEESLPRAGDDWTAPIGDRER